MPRLFDSSYPNGFVDVKHISPYLIDAPDIFIEPRATSFFNVPKMIFGSMPRDGGNLILSPEERDELVAKEPRAEKWIRPYVGSREFIQGKKRFCLWLVDCPPDELQKMPLVYQRVKAVREFRSKSKAASTRNFADTPTLFCQIAQPTTNYLLVPRVSSSKRRYIPIGYVSSEVICADANLMIPNAGLFHFGILTSSVHMTWVKKFAGRLRDDYRYSASICYNPFPWPLFYPEAYRAVIEQTAQKILDARANYPNASFADLYDEISMPADLRRAHRENDVAVLRAYPFPPDIDEDRLTLRLLEMYQNLRDDFDNIEDPL